MLQGDETEADAAVRQELDEQVDVAVGRLLATRSGAEDGEACHAVATAQLDEPFLDARAGELWESPSLTPEQDLADRGQGQLAVLEQGLVEVA